MTERAKPPASVFWTRFCLLWLLALAGYWTVLASRMPYCDDALRIYTHTSINQGVHGRPLADVAYGLLSGGMFVDVAPVSQILALACLLGAALGVVRILVREIPAVPEAGNFPNVGALMFSLLPLNLFLLNFHYDSFSMTLAIFCASAAFVAGADAGLWRFCAAAGLLWCALCLYQPMVGMYMVCVAMLSAMLCLFGAWPASLLRLGRLLLAALLGGLCYLPIYLVAMRNAALPFCGLPNHPHVNEHAGSILADVPLLLGKNILSFLDSVMIFARPNALTGCILALVGLALLAVIHARASFTRKVASLACLVLAFLACGSIEMLLAQAIFPGRCLVTLCMLILCVALLGLAGPRFARRLIIPLCVLTCIVSSLMLAAYGNAQRDQYEFEEQTVLVPLWQDMAAQINERRKNGEVFRFFVKGDLPLHYTLRKVNANYYFISTPSAGLFVAQRLMSWLPLKFDLPAVFLKINPDEYPLLVSRIGFDIRLFRPDTFMIVLKRDFAPQEVAPYESARYFGLAGMK